MTDISFWMHLLIVFSLRPKLSRAEAKGFVRLDGDEVLIQGYTAKSNGPFSGTFSEIGKVKKVHVPCLIAPKWFLSLLPVRVLAPVRTR